MTEDYSTSVRRAICILEEWGVTRSEVFRILDPEASDDGDGYSSLTSAVNPLIETRAHLIEAMDNHLRVLLPQEHAKWVKMENVAPLFGGSTPVALLLTGKISEIRKVERWLAGWVHG